MARTRKPVVEVRRSQRRRRTVSAYRDGERVVVLIPDRFSRAEETEWVERMLARLAAREERIQRTDDELQIRARRLTNRYLADHAERVRPASVRWVTNQNGRWGSCTPDDGTIRISHRIQEMPDWVIDYVLLHELSHLVVPSHNAEFWELVNRFGKAERARGYLEGISAATGLVLADD
ncbi:M48 metallopeptidase family protein [Paractinoplanes lichenicola]|uniref:M48 family metallopeptidase n=1 Tax=Paractinoplanes lichenicola TaxID=2802976 RepID=A0ABS1VJT6_9ACTN|nr:M48 family metallopeptidase [Actinoplanes lichenicola]MBL7254977.1 M48 family metallopeptidase [Actinoplanes lichenicola]